MNNKKKLGKILENEYIYPVYQPIVSLSDGQIFGYEALSRISRNELDMNIETMFRVADLEGKSWELESLCRKKALKNSRHMLKTSQLFINVNPNIIHDKEFIEGFTKERLEKYGLNIENITFEITERVSVVNNELFSETIQHYKKQDYRIAIDDVGSGYSGLNTIVNIHPHYIKIDMSLIKNIDKDEIKLSMCKNLIEFCKSANIEVIAEGIETEEELKILIKIGATFGQGHFLGMPDKEFKSIAAEKVDLIRSENTKRYKENVLSSVYPKIETLCKEALIVSPNEDCMAVHDILTKNPLTTEVCILENQKIVGFITRTKLFEILGGRYGYSLYAKKKIIDISQLNFLKVSHNVTIEDVSVMAMQRPLDQLYDPIIVEKEKSYLGAVTIKNILEATAKIKLDIAMHSNPLTGLPGNLLIEKEILNRIFSSSPYCIFYIDVDNFKAYNDAYGFTNGDLLLKLISEILKEICLKNEFIGHIGGDDFMVICDYEEGGPLCINLLDIFSERVKSLYKEEDVKSGYIISKNRNGVTEKFPLATLSIAGVCNNNKSYSSVDSFSFDVASLKKKCKQQLGNYYEII